VEGRDEREGVGRNTLEKVVGEGECGCARVYWERFMDATPRESGMMKKERAHLY
jgi:hypothetical protein